MEKSVDEASLELTKNNVIVPEISTKKPNFRKDIRSILLLLLLYILQGIPLGLIVTIPFLLQSKNVPYTDQARFSLAFWPFGLKVLYAPIVDAVYWQRLGRRKSWIIPLQYLIAIFFFVIAAKVDDLFEAKDVTSLTIMFFCLNFLAASQDVAVDGWALTMMAPENVGYASTCNAVGQTLGFVLGFSGFLALNSPSFANKFRAVPGEVGLVTLPQFLVFWAIIFAVTTTFILLFKKEKKESLQVTEGHMDIFESYRNLWRILKLRNVQILALFLLTVRIGTGASDALARLKLVEKGIPKETLALFSIFLIPLKLALPILTAKWTVGPNPMKVYINTIPFSILFGLIWPLLVYWAGWLGGPGTEYPFWFYAILFAATVAELVPGYTRFVTGMGFSAKISDPEIGGTYMTLINTITNVGGMWPSTLALALVDYVGIGQCREVRNEVLMGMANVTELGAGIGNGTEGGEMRNVTSLAGAAGKGKQVKCNLIDGYYVESVVCSVLGLLWLFVWGRRTIMKLQRKPISTWRVIQAE